MKLKIYVKSKDKNYAFIYKKNELLNQCKSSQGSVFQNL